MTNVPPAVIDQLHAAAERAPRGTVEAATRALAAVGGQAPVVRAVVLNRGINVLTRLVTEIDERTLGDAAGAESDLLALLRVLERPEAAAALREVDPLLPARLRGLRDRERLLTTEGGSLTVTEVASLLGITRQAVDKRRRAGKLLGLPLGRRGYVYPIWQFASGALLPGLDEVLRALAGHDPWMQALFLLNANTWLDEKRPLDEVRSGRLAAVLEAARHYGQQVAA